MNSIFICLICQHGSYVVWEYLCFQIAKLIPWFPARKWMFTHLKLNSSPLKIGLNAPKGSRIVFRSHPFFRGKLDVKLRGWIHDPWVHPALLDCRKFLVNPTSELPLMKHPPDSARWGFHCGKFAKKQSYHANSWIQPFATTIICTIVAAIFEQLTLKKQCRKIWTEHRFLWRFGCRILKFLFPRYPQIGWLCWPWSLQRQSNLIGILRGLESTNYVH